MLTSNKYKVFQGIAILFALLTFVSLFLPAVFVDTGENYTLFNLMFGNEKASFQPAMVIGFIVLILGILADIAIISLTFLNKINEKLGTILAISAGVAILAGGILLGVGPFYQNGIISAMDSELGFTQGQWGFQVGMFLTIVSSLISTAMNYPTAMIILHRKDLEDKQRKLAKQNSDITLGK